MRVKGKHQKHLRGIRLRPDCRRWLLEGTKTTTFRATPRQGFYELVEGSWFKPKHLGIVVECTPIIWTTDLAVIQHHYGTEGPFKSPDEVRKWLKDNKLTLPHKGWLISVKVVKK